MNKTAIVFDPVFQDHDTGPGHPESSARLRAIGQALSSRGLMDKAMRLPLREATDGEILRVHSESHLRRIAGTEGRGGYLDGDTPTSPGSYAAARLAAGSLIAATDAVIAGDADNAFALVRPPGHHSERDRAMGFCLFNNIAIAAAHALEHHGLKRVLIVDWDVHHGNATQHSFYNDPRVLFFSIHRYPFYPGTGSIDEIGADAGRGFTVNVPVNGGHGDALYDEAFARVLGPVARRFRPELILVSAGFDAHQDDPLGGMEVTETGFVRLAGRVRRLAEECCAGRTVATLEGGYDLAGLADSVTGVLEVMMGLKQPPADSLPPVPGFERYLELARERLAGRWPELGETQ